MDTCVESWGRSPELHPPMDRHLPSMAETVTGGTKSLPALGLFLAFLVFEVVGYATGSYWTVSQVYAHVYTHHPLVANGVLYAVIAFLIIHLGFRVWNRVK